MATRRHLAQRLVVSSALSPHVRRSSPRVIPLSSFPSCSISTLSPASSSSTSSCCSCTTLLSSQSQQQRSYSITASLSSPSKPSSPFEPLSDSPFDAKKTKVKRRKFIPRKAAISLTPKARTFFKSLLEGVAATSYSSTQQSDDDDDGKNTRKKEDKDPIIGIQLTYDQSTTGEPRMVFGFSFLRATSLHPGDEVVSLEVMEDGTTPKPPAEAMEDGLPKLYVHRDAVLKVLGATLDVDEKKILPILYDKEGNVMDPNA